MNIHKEAALDAAEYARAQMAHGEGAGVRRRLIAAKVDDKCYRNPGYRNAFLEQVEAQNMTHHANSARRERVVKDVSHSVARNAKGLATGNYNNVSAGLLTVVAGAYLAHEHGWDKKALEKGKRLVRRGKTWYQNRKTVNALLDDIEKSSVKH